MRSDRLRLLKRGPHRRFDQGDDVLAVEPGDQLPKVREVAESLAINPNTVLKAYRELEREGLVVAQPGLGTFVQRSLGGASSLADNTRLRRQLVSWVHDARTAGLDQEDLEALFASVLLDSFREGIA